MNSPGFDIRLIRVIRYKFYVDHDGRYPSIMLLNPVDFERLKDEFSVVDGRYNFMATRVIQTNDIETGVFEFYHTLTL